MKHCRQSTDFGQPPDHRPTEPSGHKWAVFKTHYGQGGMQVLFLVNITERYRNTLQNLPDMPTNNLLNSKECGATHWGSRNLRGGVYRPRSIHLINCGEYPLLHTNCRGLSNRTHHRHSYCPMSKII